MLAGDGLTSRLSAKSPRSEAAEAEAHFERALGGLA
jgi:hypothetical protein